MRISDPRWPAVREVARRWLRMEHIILRGPSWLEHEVNELNLIMSDKLPARMIFPEFELVEGDVLRFIDASEQKTVAEVTFQSPEMSVVWLPMETTEAWNALKSTCLDLLEAGYPGCVGCAGPEAEWDWDEANHRREMVKLNQHPPMK
jgi:hypothetical protein